MAYLRLTYNNETEQINCRKGSAPKHLSNEAFVVAEDKIADVWGNDADGGVLLELVVNEETVDSVTL